MIAGSKKDCARPLEGEAYEQQAGSGGDACCGAAFDGGESTGRRRAPGSGVRFGGTDVYRDGAAASGMLSAGKRAYAPGGSRQPSQIYGRQRRGHV